LQQLRLDIGPIPGRYLNGKDSSSSFITTFFLPKLKFYLMKRNLKAGFVAATMNCLDMPACQRFYTLGTSFSKIKISIYKH
jgi:hypothetical protein